MVRTANPSNPRLPITIARIEAILIMMTIIGLSP